MQSITVVDPPQQTGLWCKRDDRESLDVKPPPEAVDFLVKKIVDQAEQLHHTLILTKILVSCMALLVLTVPWRKVTAHTLEDEVVVLVIATLECQSTWSLLRRDDGQLWDEAHDRDDRFARLIRSWHSEVQAACLQQFGRNELQVKRREGLQLLLDPREDAVVYLPGLLQVADFSVNTIAPASFAGFVQIPAENLRERRLASSFWPLAKGQNLPLNDDHAYLQLQPCCAEAQDERSYHQGCGR